MSSLLQPIHCTVHNLTFAYILVMQNTTDPETECVHIGHTVSRLSTVNKQHLF